MAEYAVYIEGLSELDTIDNLSDSHKIAMQRAVNRVAQKARTAANRQMRDQINWSARYLDGKLELTPARVNQENPESRIDVSFRPTSLARFVVGAKTPWKTGVRLHVDAAQFAPTKRLFIVPLKRGVDDITEENRNLGLAIRLKPGETFNKKYKVKSISKGLYLLYGPSPAQVFFTVAEDILPDAGVWLQDEYDRQMKLGSK